MKHCEILVTWVLWKFSSEHQHNPGNKKMSRDLGRDVETDETQG